MEKPRHTRQRQLVLLAVKGSNKPLTAEEVYRQAKRRYVGVGLATVYRNLDLLAGRGEVFSFEGVDGIRRFAGHVFYESKFTCGRCGVSEPVSIQKYEQQIIRALNGQIIFFSRLDVHGLCKRCSRTQAVQRKVPV